jgi:hypothetical protein
MHCRKLLLDGTNLDDCTPVPPRDASPLLLRRYSGAAHLCSPCLPFSAGGIPSRLENCFNSSQGDPKPNPSPLLWWPKINPVRPRQKAHIALPRLCTPCLSSLFLVSATDLKYGFPPRLRPYPPSIPSSLRFHKRRSKSSSQLLQKSSHHFSTTPTRYVLLPRREKLHCKTMSTGAGICSSTKTRTHGDAVIERAEQRGLTNDRSKISPHTVRRKLSPKSEIEYSRDLEVWHS